MREILSAPAVRASDTSHAAVSDATFRAADLPGLRELWDETIGDPSLSIAVLDGPVDTAHPCFDDATLKTLRPAVPKTGPSDHGTHVTSLLFGQQGSSVEGLAPACQGLILPVFTQLEDGRLKPCTQQTLAQSIAQAIEAGARIINVSGGELSSSGHAIDFLRDAVRQAGERNVLIVAATGNDGCECLHVPAALPSVLSVGALDLDQHPLGSSNWHDALEGLMAPGASIEGALPGSGVGLMNGTSFATPLVAGVAALLLSLQIRHGLAPDAAAVRRALLDSATPCTLGSSTECRRLLRGTLNVAGARELVLRAVRAAGRSQSSSPNNPSATQGDAMTETASPGVQPHELDAAPPEAPLQAAVTPSDDDVQKSQTAQSAQPQVAPSCVGGCSGTASDSATAATDGALVAPSQSQSLVAPSPPTSSSSLPATQPTVPNGPSLATPGLVTPSVVSPSVVSPSAVAPSCQNLALFSPFPPGQKVFSIGKLYYDFGTEARRDYFIAQVRAQFIEQGLGESFNQGLVYNPDVMYRYLFNKSQRAQESVRADMMHAASQIAETNQDTANGLIWTLFIDQDPVYALIPEDQFSLLSFVRLTNFLQEQTTSRDPSTYRVAMSGVITGNVTLFNGTVVPSMSFAARGMYNWDISSLLEAMDTGSDDGEKTGTAKANGDVDQDLRDFLLRVYDALRNLGVSSEDRAKNFAATNAYQARQAFVWANSDGRAFKLDGITAGRSPICRRNSDCWDIKLTFFDPQNLFQAARQVFEYTIDVSDLIPVQVGEPRIYPVYGGPQG